MRQAILAQDNKLASVQISSGVSHSMHQALQHAVDASFISGFRAAMLIASGLALVAALFSLLFVKGKSSSSHQSEQ